MNGKLNELKIDYTSRLQEIIEGNIKLNLKFGINLKDENINNLDFNNINNVKTNLEALEKQYFGQLTSKCDALKTEYDGLVEKKKDLGKDIKKQVEELCNLADADFDIKKYSDFNTLKTKICIIECLVNGKEEDLKGILKNRYESYSTINDNLNLGINDFNKDDLKNKIETFDKANFLVIIKTLDKIYEYITAKIKEINSDLKKEYNETIKEIAFFNSTKEDSEKFTGEEINYLTIDEKTTEDQYNDFKNSINTLKNEFKKKLEKSKNSYEKEINYLNEKLESLYLSLDKIDLTNDLNNLTFEILEENTISSIQKSISDAENKCKTVENYREECKEILEQVKNEFTYSDIKDNSDIKKSIEEIDEKIKKINDDEEKNAANDLILALKTKIKEANLQTINEIINDKNLYIKSAELNGIGFINLLNKKLEITHYKDESNKSTIGKTGTKIKELHHFVRNKKKYFIIFYEIDDFKLDSTTFNRKVVLVTSNNVITIGYYYYSITSKTNLFLKCNSTKKLCETKISYGDFIKCIWTTKNVNFDGLLMKFKTDVVKYNDYQNDKYKKVFVLI